MLIKSEKELREIFGFPKGRTIDKQLKSLDSTSINFIEKSPFIIIATFNNAHSVDSSPRGGIPGFVNVINNNRIVIPVAKGNNRLDSLVNIIETGKIGCLFLIPGIDETLRINGQALISTSEEFLGFFTNEKNIPKACILVEIEEVFLHCAKALMRSKLWDESSKIERSNFPTMGEMLRDQLSSMDEVESQDDMIKRYNKDL